jgi:hypothetical protein
MRTDGRDGAGATGARGWAARIVWFVALWLAGVAVVGTIAWLLRLWLL